MEHLLDIHDKSSKEWLQFSSVTLNNLQEIESCIEQVENKRKAVEDTINSIKMLSQHSQAKSYVQLCPKAYISAIIKHTGEYNVEVNSEYQCTLTKDQTIEYLEEQLAEQNGMLDNYRTQKEQLQKRLGYDFTETVDAEDISGMPEKIVTENGIAFKQGSFYEIMEVEANIPYKKNEKRVSRVKQNQDGIPISNFIDLNIG